MSELKACPWGHPPKFDPKDGPKGSVTCSNLGCPVIGHLDPEDWNRRSDDAGRLREAAQKIKAHMEGNEMATLWMNTENKYAANADLRKMLRDLCAALSTPPATSASSDGCVCPNPKLHRELAEGRKIDPAKCAPSAPSEESCLMCKKPDCIRKIGHSHATVDCDPPAPAKIAAGAWACTHGGLCTESRSLGGKCEKCGNGLPAHTGEGGL